MLNFVEGDIFEKNADIQINTINCVGVMGAGIALGFKKRYPEMFKDYKNKCRKKIVKPGRPYIWTNRTMFEEGVIIVNFPTKDHWRHKSEYNWIETGLNWLKDFLKDKKDKTVSIPALGCGHGKLNWAVVQSMIKESLEDSPADIYVYPPKTSRM